MILFIVLQKLKSKFLMFVHDEYIDDMVQLFLKHSENVISPD